MDAEEKKSAGVDRRPAWVRYGFALLTFALALLVRAAIDPWLGHKHPFGIFYLSVTISVWFWGRNPAVLVAILGFLAGDFFFIPPANQFNFLNANAEQWAGAVLYALIVATIIYATDRMREAQSRAEASMDEARQKQHRLEQEIRERSQAQEHQRQLFEVMKTVNRAEALPAVFEAALEGICNGLVVGRAAVLFYDDDKVMRFKAWRGLSDQYRRAVEGHTPWRPDELDPQPVCISNTREAPMEEHLRAVITREGIGALAFIPLCFEHRLIGKFMIYHNEPHVFTTQEIRLTQSIASQVAFAAMRQKGEEALRRSEERFRAFFQTRAVGTAQIHLNGNIISVNDQFCEITGYPREELIGRPAIELSPVEDRPPIQEKFTCFMNGSVPVYEVEKRFLRKDGEIIWVQAAAGMIHNAEGKPICAAAVFMDITERKHAEERLRESEARFRSYAESTQDVIWITDPLRHKLEYLSPAFEQLWGVSREGVNVARCLEAVHPEDRVRVRKAFFEAGPGSQPKIEYRIVRPDGSVRWISDYGFAVYDAQGGIRLVAGIARDITERKEAEEALQRGEEFLNQAVNVAGLGTFEHNHLTDHLHFSEKAREIGGWVPGEPLTMLTFLDRIHPEDREKTVAAIRKAHDPAGDGRYRVEYRFLKPNGQVAWVSVRSQTFFEGEGNARHALRTVGAILDTTERKRFEQNIEQSEARLRLAVETAELGLYDRDLVRNEVSMDVNCRKIMGLPPQGELNPEVAVASLHPDDRDLVLPLVAKAFNPQLREVCGADFRIITPQGKIRWVSGRGRVIFEDRADAPHPLRFVGILQDISERKELELQIKHSQAELEKYAQELEERVTERTANLQQTIDSLEGVLYHVAHDLRAPLRAMHSFSTMLLNNYASKLDPTGADFARRIADSSVKMDVLIRDLLIYGRLGHQMVAWSSVDLNVLFDRLLQELHPEIAHRHAQIQLQKPLPRVWADPKILEQILANLLSNALKFTAPETPPRIDVWGEQADGTVSLSIRDQGIGIAEEYYERIFGIFERLHETDAYPGTGIGLAIVRKGIDLLGGQVEVESELGQGSRFVLTLKSTPQFHERPHM